MKSIELTFASACFCLRTRPLLCSAKAASSRSSQNPVRQLAAFLSVILCVLLAKPATAEIYNYLLYDIGNPTPAGTLSGGNGTYSLSGGGTGIGGSSDSFAFASVPTNGTMQFVARINSQTTTTLTPLAGIMLRKSISASSAHAFVGVDKNNVPTFVYRTTDGGTSTTTSASAMTGSVWVRLVFTQQATPNTSVAVSSDGLTWNQIGTCTLPLSAAAPAFLGMAVTSGDTGALNTASFDQVSYLVSAPGVGTGPTNPILWLRADAGVTANGSSQVSDWLDQSGYGNNASQVLAQNMPILTANVIAGKPAITFDGINSYLNLALGQNILNKGTSCYAVIKPTQTTVVDKRIFTLNGIGGTANVLGFSQNSSTSWSALVAQNSHQSGPLTTETPALLQLSQDGSSGYVSTNGVMTSTFQSPSMQGAVSSAFVGASTAGNNLFQGNLAELLMYNNGSLYNPDIDMIFYVLSKYGVGPRFSTSTSPTISPAASVFVSEQTVTITGSSGCIVYFTTDGSDPSTSNTAIPYTGPFSISSTTIVRACESRPFYALGPAASATFIKDPNVARIPTDGRLLWLRSDAGVKYSDTSPYPVSRWTDLSGSGNTAVQSSTAQPNYIANAAPINLPAISFDGASNHLDLPTGFSDFTNGMSLFVVTKPTTIVAGKRIINFSTGTTAPSTTNSFYLSESSATAANCSIYAGTTANSLAPAASLSINAYQYLELIHDGAGSMSLYQNSILKGTDSTFNNIANVARSWSSIGSFGNSSNYFAGEIAEVMLFNRNLNADERTAVESYLYQRYGTGTPPKAVPPTISPNAIVLSGGQQTITMTSANSLPIVYSTDEGATWRPYTAPFMVATTTKIRARISNAQNYSDSDESVAFIQFDTTTEPVPRNGLQVWMKADNGVLQTNNTVTEWRDSSGNGRSAMATGTPTYSTSAFGTMPGITFSGTGQYFTWPTDWPTFSDGETVFMVVHPVTYGLNDRFFEFSNGLNNHNDSFFLSEIAANRANFTVYNGASAQSLAPPAGSMLVGQPQLLEVLHRPDATATFYSCFQTSAMEPFSGTLQNITSAARPNAIIGGYKATTGAPTLLYSGRIAEMLIFDRALTDEERKATELYLTKRYDLKGPQIAPPSLNVPDAMVSDKPVVVTISGTSEFKKVWTPDAGASAQWFEYTGPINVTTSSLIRAKLTAPGWSDSPEVTTYISIDPQAHSIPRNGLRFWHKADNGVETMDTSTSVLAWRDSSGNGRTAIKTGAASPAYNTTTATPFLTFDGTSQYLSLPAYAAPSGDKTIFVVAKPGTLGANKRLLDFGTGSATTNSFYLSESSASPFKAAYTVYDGAPNTAANPMPLVTGTRYLFEVLHSGTTADIYSTNSSSQTPLTGQSIQAPSVVSRTINSIGRSSANTLFFGGDILEILVWDRALTENERLSVESYLGNKFDLSARGKRITSITPVSGVYSKRTSAMQPSITITSENNVGNIRYTLDGSLPDSTSRLYAGQFLLPTAGLPETITLRAAVVNSWGTGPIRSVQYQFDDNSFLAVVQKAASAEIRLWLKPDWGLETDPAGRLLAWRSAWPGTLGGDAIQSSTDLTKHPIVRRNIIGGYPTVSFDGIGQFLTFSSISNPAEFRIFAVIRPESAQAGQLVAMTDATGGAPLILERSTNGKDVNFRIAPSDPTGPTATNALALGRYQLLEAYCGPDPLPAYRKASISVNGIELATAVSANVGTPRTKFTIGSNSSGAAPFFKGGLAELLILVQPTEFTVQSTRAYLINKYQLLSLVPSHPTLSTATGTVSLPGPTQVALCAPAGVEIRFTKDGSAPSAQSELYQKPLEIYFSQTIRAIAVKNGLSSDEVSATYELDPAQWPAPNPADLSPLQIELKLPTNATP